MVVDRAFNREVVGLYRSEDHGHGLGRETIRNIVRNLAAQRAAELNEAA